MGGYCKHCVAVIAALAGGSQEAKPRGAVALEPRHEQWLKALEYSEQAQALAPSLSEPPKHFVYTFTLQQQPSAPTYLFVTVSRAPSTKHGFLGTRTPVNIANIDWSRDSAASPLDRAIIARLGPSSMGYFSVIDKEGAQLLWQILSTGRAFFASEHVLLALSDGPAQTGELTFTSDALARERPTLTVADDALILPVCPPHYVDLRSGHVGAVRVPQVSDAFAFQWIMGAPIEPDAASSLASRLLTIRLPHLTPLPRVRKIREVRCAPRVVLRLTFGHLPLGSSTPLIEAQPGRAWARVFFDYDGERVDPSEPHHPRKSDTEVIKVRRNSHEEQRLLGALALAGLIAFKRVYPLHEAPEGTALAFPKTPSFAFGARVEALAAKHVIVERDAHYPPDTMVADDLTISFDEGAGTTSQLAVSLGIRIGDETVEALPLILAALQAKGTSDDDDTSLIVTLLDGRSIKVDAARLAPLRAILLELASKSGTGEVSPLRALALDPAVVARSPASLAKLRASLTSPIKIAVPKTLRATLRDYQRDGFLWLLSRRRAGLGAVLADDMGLGKTVQTLALLLAEERNGKPSLVVCPKSVLDNWKAEAERFAPKLKVHVHHGADRDARLGELSKAALVLTTYSLLARDTALFTTQPFSTVVLDEAQMAKTATSAVTHAACALKADFRLALSGTPMENNLGELWSVMRFALPELFGDSRTFTRVFRTPIEREGSDEARHALVKRLAPFVLRRRKEQVASELPQKTIIVETVVLDDTQRDVYETVRAAMDKRVREALAARGLAKSHIVVLDALLKLRQAVCDPRLLPARTAKKAGSAKLEALVEKLRELAAEGRRVLVFSQFVTMLEIIEKELKREKIGYLMLTGETENRGDLVSAFQRGDVPVFLLSLKAGGTGLNLTAADVVIHYDPWWNPAAEAQATDRAHRIGQDKPVFVYKLVGKDTIEEKILGLQAKKQALFASILDQGAGAAKKLTEGDVAFLFER
jgi:superfamily II DNA or RNA helicase